MISYFKIVARSIFIVITGLVFLSCATSKRVLDADTFNSYHKIGVAPYLYSNLPNDLPKSDFTSLTNVCDSLIISDIGQLHNIKKINKVLDDTLFTSMYSKSDTSIFNYASARQIDALLFCNIRYQKYSYMFIPTIIAETRIYCIDVKTRKTVIDVSYNNKNDVGVDETYENTTKLSVGGAVNSIIEALNRN